MILFSQKDIRSKVIVDYYGRDVKYICFSSGNAVAELKKLGVAVFGCGDYEGADYKPDRWFTQKEIAETFPSMVDVTCGHLPIELMSRLASAYKERLGELDTDEPYTVMTGSGETIVCFKMAYPNVEFIAQYNMDSHTKYNKEAPLNKLVELVAKTIIL